MEDEEMRDFDTLIKQEQEQLETDTILGNRSARKEQKLNMNDELNKILTGRVGNFMSEKQTNCKRNVATRQSQPAYASVFQKRSEFNTSKISTENCI